MNCLLKGEVFNNKKCYSERHKYFPLSLYLSLSTKGINREISMSFGIVQTKYYLIRSRILASKKQRAPHLKRCGLKSPLFLGCSEKSLISLTSKIINYKELNLLESRIPLMLENIGILRQI